MTVTTTFNSITYAANGVTAAFAFPYIFFAPTDLVVTLVNSATSAVVSPPPVLNGGATYDYTVTGDFADGEYASGATVTFNTAPITGYTVLLVRTVPATQTVTLIDNTKFPAQTVNVEFDKLTILAQQSSFLTSTALQIPSYEVGLIVTAVPAASRANRLLVWDALGNLTTIDPASLIGGSVPGGPASGDLAGAYPGPTIKPSVALTGTPTAPTAAAGTNTTQLATTAFVDAAVKANGFRLLQRTAVGSAVVDVNIQNIAADINDLQFTFDLTPVSNAVNLVLQMYDNTGTVVNAAAQYSGSSSYSTSAQTMLTAPTVVTATGLITTGMEMSAGQTVRHVGNVSGIRGSGSIPNIRASRHKTCSFATGYTSDDASAVVSVNGVWTRNGAATSLTGIRLFFTAGNIASGAFSVWGSP